MTWRQRLSANSDTRGGWFLLAWSALGAVASLSSDITTASSALLYGVCVAVFIVGSMMLGTTWSKSTALFLGVLGVGLVGYLPHAASVSTALSLPFFIVISHGFLAAAWMCDAAQAKRVSRALWLLVAGILGITALPLVFPEGPWDIWIGVDAGWWLATVCIFIGWGALFWHEQRAIHAVWMAGALCTLAGLLILGVVTFFLPDSTIADLVPALHPGVWWLCSAWWLCGVSVWHKEWYRAPASMLLALLVGSVLLCLSGLHVALAWHSQDVMHQREALQRKVLPHIAFLDAHVRAAIQATHLLAPSSEKDVPSSLLHVEEIPPPPFVVSSDSGKEESRPPLWIQSATKNHVTGYLWDEQTRAWSAWEIPSVLFQARIQEMAPADIQWHALAPHHAPGPTTLWKGRRFSTVLPLPWGGPEGRWMLKTSLMVAPSLSPSPAQWIMGISFLLSGLLWIVSGLLYITRAQALRASRLSQRLMQIQHAAGLHGWEWPASKTRLAAVEHALGTPPHTLQQGLAGLLGHVPAEFQESLWGMWKKGLKGEQDSTIHPITFPGEALRWLEHHVSLGHNQGHVTILTQDVTQRMCLRQVLDVRTKALGVLEQGVAIFDLSSQQVDLMYINPRLRSWMGDEQTCQDSVFLKTLLKDMKVESCAHLKHALRDAGDQGLTLEWRVPAEMCGGRLSWMWVQISLVPREEHEDTTLYAVMVLQDISSLKDHAEQLEYVAWHDQLTGVLNRAAIHGTLETWLNRPAPDNQCGIVVLNVARLHHVNTAWGYRVGDACLKEVARRLKEIPGVEVGRLSGDEFVVLREKDATAGSMETLGRVVLEVLRRPFENIGPSVFSLSYSAGVVWAPEAGLTPEALLSHADLVLTRAKKEGRNQVVLYVSRMALEAEERIRLVTDMQGSLERGEFTVCLQPQYRGQNKVLVGAEALLRWQHPVLGTIPPSVFIPLAEESGFIHTLGRWVIRYVLLAQQRWKKSGKTLVPIAVNVSSVQMMRHEFVMELEEDLLASGLPSSLLHLELTETVYFDPQRAHVKALQHLRALGILCAIDDFGTGYASLGQLRYVSVDLIKIDRSFVTELDRGPHGNILCKTIINLAHHFNAQVVAEGVETEAQAKALWDMGCQIQQGYLHGRPVPLDMFETELLESASPYTPSELDRQRK